MISSGLKVVLPPEAKGKPAPPLVMSYEGLQNAVIVDDAGVASNQFASHPSDAEIERGRVGSEHDFFYLLRCRDAHALSARTERTSRHWAAHLASSCSGSPSPSPAETTARWRCLPG